MESLRIAWLNQLDPLHPAAGGAERHIDETCQRLGAMGHSVTVFGERTESLPGETQMRQYRIRRPAGRFGLHPWVREHLWSGVPGPEKFDLFVHDLSKVVPWTIERIPRHPSLAMMRHINGRILFDEAPWYSSLPLWLIERSSPRYFRNLPMVVEAQLTREIMIRLGANPNSIGIVRPGVDHAAFQPAPDLRSPFPLIVYVGRLKKYKGLELALNAFVRVLRRRPEARVVIAGVGDQGDHLERRSRALGLEGRVTFPGRVTQPELAELYQRAWVHVQPSLVEGWGLTVLEAAACGTPTVAFRNTCLEESVGPPSAPFLVGHRTADGLATQLLRCLVAVEGSVGDIGARCVDYAREFTWEASASGFAHALRATLARDALGGQADAVWTPAPHGPPA